MHKAQASNIVVAVIDTGASTEGENIPYCKVGHMDFTKSGITGDESPSRHGSNVTSVIARNAGSKGYCIVHLKVYRKDRIDLTAYFAALKYVTDLRPNILNLSLSGGFPIEEETKLIKLALDQGTVVVAAAGNKGLILTPENCNTYPACIDRRIFVIGAKDQAYSNKGSIVDTYENAVHYGGGVTLSGTSQAAAQFTGKAIKLAVEQK